MPRITDWTHSHLSRFVIAGLLLIVLSPVAAFSQGQIPCPVIGFLVIGPILQNGFYEQPSNAEISCTVNANAVMSNAFGGSFVNMPGAGILNNGDIENGYIDAVTYVQATFSNEGVIQNNSGGTLHNSYYSEH